MKLLPPGVSPHTGATMCMRVCCNAYINGTRQGGAAPFGIPLGFVLGHSSFECA